MLFSMDEKQLIVYGAPGTGKSFQINEALNSNGFSTGNVIRIVFHKDYSYSDFIGYVSPITTTDNQIEYSFKAGPFAKALRLSLEKNEPVCLLIEIINGNARISGYAKNDNRNTAYIELTFWENEEQETAADEKH